MEKRQARVLRMLSAELENCCSSLIRREYLDVDIFNADETGLFWRMLPDTTHVLKGQTCAGGKRAKNRITVLVGTSAMGEKLPLLVIGRYAKPRCFKNSSPPIKYVSNKKAWMTAEIFESPSGY